MRRPKRSPLHVYVATISLVLAACGAGSPPGPSTDTPANPTAAGTPRRASAEALSPASPRESSAAPSMSSSLDEGFFDEAWPAPDFIVAHPPKGQRPAIRTTEVMVGDPQGQLVAFMGRHKHAVTACYQAGVARDAALEGRVVLGLTVKKERVVEEVRVLADKTTLRDEAVIACIRDELLGSPMPFFGEGTLRFAYRYELVLRPPTG